MLTAQRTGQPIFDPSQAGDPQDTLGQDDFVDARDTFGVFYFYADNPSKITPFQDTFLNNFQQIDPTRTRKLDYANLGILGSAHQSLVFSPIFRKGFDVGFHQFDLYYIQPEEIKFYVLENAFTNLFYSQGAEQLDGYFKGEFSRNFANGINVTLNYRRLNQAGRANQYPRQNVLDEALGTGLWWHAANDRYDGFFYFSSNTTEQQDNGGVIQEPVIEGQFGSPSSAEVVLSEADTRHTNRAIGYRHYYKLAGATEEKPDRRAFTLSHNALYRVNTYKFSNPTTRGTLEADSIYFGPLFVYDKGLRMYIRTRSVENSFTISTFRVRKEANAEVAEQLDRLEVGISHQINWINQDISDTTVNTLFVTGRWDFQPGERVQVNTYAHLGLWNNAGDYRASGDLFFDLRPAGQLRLEAVNQLYSPTLIESRFYLSQQKVWENDFKKTLSTSLAATYSLPKIGFSATGRYQLLNNYVYFDSTGFSRQIGEPISITQLILEENIKLGILHFDNVITLQKVNEDVIRLPEVYSKHSLYLQGLLFRRVLEFQVGVDVRVNTSYFPYYYQPAVGQFVLQNRQEQQLYPYLDAYASVKVSQFRFFVRGENLNNLITEQFYYPIAFYPQQVFYIRFGLGWRFVN